MADDIVSALGSASAAEAHETLANASGQLTRTADYGAVADFELEVRTWLAELAESTGVEMTTVIDSIWGHTQSIANQLRRRLDDTALTASRLARAYEQEARP